jgi:hypothetical protein
LFYAFVRRLGLARDDEHDLRRQALAAVAVGWVPLPILAALENLLGTDSRLIWSLSVHMRLLVAVPLFLWSESVLERACERAVHAFIRDEFAADSNMLERIIRSTSRIRDSWWPELALLGAAIALCQFLLWQGNGATGLVGEQQVGARELSAVHLWYGFCGLPLFQFLLTRTLWRWLIWSAFLWRLSRLRLRLVPTHPDLAGGISHLARPVQGFAVALLASSAVLASAWGSHILAGQASLSSFATPFAALVLVAELVAVGPLLAFTGQLFQARSRGRLQYGAFALRYTLDFHVRWIEPPDQPIAELLGSPDIQSLADLANSFKVVDSMRLVPFGPRLLSNVFVAIVLPMLPLCLSEMSLWELLSKIGQTLLGGRLE